MYGEITSHGFIASKAAHMQDFEIFQTNVEYRNLLHTPYLYASCIACKLYIIYYLPGSRIAARIRALSKTNNAGFLGARDASSPSKPCVIAAHEPAMLETGNEIGTGREKRKWV